MKQPDLKTTFRWVCLSMFGHVYSELAARPLEKKKKKKKKKKKHVQSAGGLFDSIWEPKKNNKTEASSDGATFG